jgi:hypothetical protein
MSLMPAPDLATVLAQLASAVTALADAQAENARIQADHTQAIAQLANALKSAQKTVGSRQDAATLLDVSVKQIDRYIRGEMSEEYVRWEPQVHWWREGKLLKFDLHLLDDWKVNKLDAVAHGRAIALRRKELLSQQKKRA